MEGIKPYEKYKDSGIAWLGEIPEHWEIKKLKYNADILNGYAFKSTEYQDAGIPIVRIGDLKNEKFVNINGKFVSNNYVELASFFIIRKSDILVALTGATIGKSSVYNHSQIALLNQRVGLLRTKADYNQNFLQKIITSTAFTEYVNLECGGSAQENIGKPELNNFFIQTPPKHEQTAIANFLDYKTAKIDRFIFKKKQLIKLLNEQKAGIINDAVTKGLNPKAKMKPSGIEWLGDIPEHWKIVKLTGVCDLIRGNSTFKKDELLSDGKYVALQYGKTYKVNEVNKKYEFYVNEEFFKESQTVKYGDVIFISTSETMEDLGHSVFYNRSDLGLLGGEQILLKANNEIVNAKYLYYSTKVFAKGLRKYATGVKVFRFKIYDLKTIYTSVPNIQEQQKIVAHIEKETSIITKTIETIEKEIALVQEYRTALIAEAVTGKIDVREYKVPSFAEDKEYAEMEEEMGLVAEEEINLD